MPIDNDSPYLVFISHSATDTVGADFDEEIRNALDHAHKLVVLLTPWAWGVHTSGPRLVSRGGAGCQSSACFMA